MSRQLEVRLFDNHVGDLMQINGKLAFSYAPAWLQRTDAVALSYSLPLQAELFDDHATRPFFAGLLPEGNKRKLIAQTLQVSRQNDFALLDGIGGECAGAVSFLEPGQRLPQAADAEQVRWLDKDELLRLLDELPFRPMLVGEQGLRLSLAGAQDKLPVVVKGEKIGLPLNGSPSSHILKPAIAAVEDSVLNEGFCMALAGAMQLDVAKTAIHQVGDRRFLLVERYDRQVDAVGQLHRLHQEDFCQALGIAPEYKYQNEGGPDLAQCFALLRKATRPSAPQTLRLLDFVIFNALIGNHDAHAKNFSLLYSANGVVLAPLYDVLSTAVYSTLTPKMAMKLGSKYRFTEVEASHWARFAQDAELSSSQVRKRIIQLAQRLPPEARKLKSDDRFDFSSTSLLERIIDLIEHRCALTIARLTKQPERT